MRHVSGIFAFLFLFVWVESLPPGPLRGLLAGLSLVLAAHTAYYMTRAFLDKRPEDE